MCRAMSWGVDLEDRAVEDVEEEEEEDGGAGLDVL